MVSNEILQKFKNLYQEKFNVSLTDEEATQMTNDVVNLMQVLLEPDPEESQENSPVKERRHDETISTSS